MRAAAWRNIFIPSTWEANYGKGAYFKDKIVLIGATGSLEKDIFLSPFGIVGGPEAHLNALNGLLAGAFLYESSEWLDVLLVFAGGVMAFVGGVKVRHPLARMALVALLLSPFSKAQFGCSTIGTLSYQFLALSSRCADQVSLTWSGSRSSNGSRRRSFVGPLSVMSRGTWSKS